MRIFFFFLIPLFSTCLLHAQQGKQVKQMAYRDSARLSGIFIDLHRNPELGFMETRTSGIVAKELKALGYEVITGIAKTGVVGILRNGAGPIVMYRADMDALPVKEKTGLAYASTSMVKKEDGSETPVMHACGHDAHVTWLLGIAKIMADLKNDWKGTLIMLAQPAEEPVIGAKAMVADNMYEKGVPIPDYLLGMHTKPIPVGKIENGYGPRFAGTDQLDVMFTGIGGHGSSPEATRDPIVMGAAAIMLYQTIISRNIAAQDAAVITVGAFHAGMVNNVIPSSAELKLNIRWFNDSIRNALLDGIKKINESIGLINGLPKEKYPAITMKGNAAPLVNDAGLVTKINKSLASQLGAENIISNSPAAMTSEDFQHLVLHNKKTVYDYILVGTANPALVAKAKSLGKNEPFSYHNDNYQVDLGAIPLGTHVGCIALLELFKK